MVVSFTFIKIKQFAELEARFNQMNGTRAHVQALLCTFEYIFFSQIRFIEIRKFAEASESYFTEFEADNEIIRTSIPVDLTV